jgi:hypothetical protein
MGFDDTSGRVWWLCHDNDRCCSTELSGIGRSHFAEGTSPLVAPRGEKNPSSRPRVTLVFGSWSSVDVPLNNTPPAYEATAAITSNPLPSRLTLPRSIPQM